MTILTISAAAHAAGIDRRTLQRAIKSGRLSATANAAGERGIDLAELIRVFGPLREMPQESPQGQSAVMSQDAPGGAAGAALLEALRDQVRQAQEQLRQAHEREQQAQQEKARLLALLEAEQAARRELETKLLPRAQTRADRQSPDVGAGGFAGGGGIRRLALARQDRCRAGALTDRAAINR